MQMAQPLKSFLIKYVRSYLLFAVRSEHFPSLSDQSVVPWVPVGTLLIGLFMATLDSFIVIVAEPQIKVELGASAGEVQWVLASYQLSYAVALITAGRVAERVGRRRVFVVGTWVFVAASIFCALSPNPISLIIARVVQGLGAAMMVPQVFATITVLVPEHHRSRVFGVVGLVIGIASVGGQLLGGFFVGANLFGSSWRPIFAINVPIGIVTTVLAMQWVPETRATVAKRLDLAGVGILALAMLSLMFPLVQGGEYGWPRWMFALLATSVLLFGGFVAVERNVQRCGGDPLIRLDLFAQRSFSTGLVLVLCVYAVVSSYYLALAVSMQDGLGLTALESGLVYAPAAVMFFVFSLVAGRLVPTYGRRVLMVGAAVLALGYLSVIGVLAVAGTITPWLVIPSLMVQSIGGGLLITPSLNTVLARIALADAGSAAGALSTAQQVGAALGVAIIGGIFYHHFDASAQSSALAAAHAFTAASFAAFLAAVLALLLVLLLPPARNKGSK